MNPRDDGTEQGESRCEVIHATCSGSTFEILRTVLAHRTDGEVIGCVIDETTATVHWDTLVTSERLSTTERAILHIARGCCTIERHGIRADHASVVMGAIAGAVDTGDFNWRWSAAG